MGQIMSGIVCLGWGSLVWDARDLPIEGGWNFDGPNLPLEFARQSKDDRITIVILDIEHEVPVLWANMQVSSLDQAINALADREGVTNLNTIGRWPNATSQDYLMVDRIAEWARKKGFSGVVWTALKPGMKEMRGVIPTLDELTIHMGKLDVEALTKAREYIVKAPAQIATPYRNALIKACEASRKDAS